MSENTRQVAFRGAGFSPKRMRGIGAIVFVVLILLAEWGTQTGWISALTLPKPSDVLATFGELYNSGRLFDHLAPSLTRLVMGSLIGGSLGIAVGTMIGLFSLVRAGLVPLVAAIFPIPKIALLPLFINDRLIYFFFFLGFAACAADSTTQSVPHGRKRLVVT